MKKVGATAVFLVDDEDWEKVMAYRWFVTDRGYIVSSSNKRVRLHRMIAGAQEGQEVDHINGNKLDNRKENLRFVTRYQNNWNVPRRKNSYSKYKGVHIDSHTGMWRAQIMANGTNYRSRRMDSEAAAAKWYDQMAKELHGIYAHLNFPEDCNQSFFSKEPQPLRGAALSFVECCVSNKRL